jgi:putative tryptophan/tyrosine transport system substrate-binding protein
MKRREFIAGLGSAAALPLGALAQQSSLPLVGYLNDTSESGAGPTTPWNAAFRRALNEQGFVEGRSVEILYRWADLHTDRLPALAADLVGRRVSVIFANNLNAADAAKAATETIPVVFAVGNDPVEAGLVASLNRPGGNLTGASFMMGELTGKRFEIMRQMLSSATSIALFVNPTNPMAELQIRESETAARRLGMRSVVANANSPSEFERLFEKLVEQRIDALIAVDYLVTIHRQEFAALAARFAVPVIYHLGEIVEAGGLISYGASLSGAFHLAGTYAGRILKGEKPSDLPVQQSTRIEMVLNLKAAKALGLEMPTSILLAADKVIE